MLILRTKVYVDTSQGYDAPCLYLNGTRGVDGSLGLPAVFKNVSFETISDEITFTYTVEFADTIMGVTLEAEDTDAIRNGDAPFLDLLAREVNVTLPGADSDKSLSATSSLSIDTAVPVVTAVWSSLEGGEYGVGQVMINVFTSNRGTFGSCCRGARALSFRL